MALSTAACVAIVLTCFAAPAAFAQAKATDFYVDNLNPSSSDTGPGTEAQPYRTISAAITAHKGAGTTIFVKRGIYREMVTINASGTATYPFVIQAMDGPVLVDGSEDFSGTSKWTSYTGSVFLAAGVTWSPLQVFVDGVRLTVSTSSPAFLEPNSFEWVSGQGLYVNIGGSNPGSRLTLVGKRASAFYLSGRSYVKIDGFTTTHCDDRAIRLGSSSNFVTISHDTSTFNYRYGIYATGCSNVTIERCAAAYNADHGIALTNSATNQSLNCIIQDNESFRNAHQTTRKAVGIWVFGSPGTVVQRNRLHDNQDSGVQIESGSDNSRSIQNVSWNNGDHGFDQLHASGVSHIGDVAYGNFKDGFSIEGIAPNGRVYNCIAINNGVTTNEFNLWVDAESSVGFAGDYNIFWNSTSRPPVKFASTQYATIAAFTAATGQDAHSNQVDPRFINPGAGDFHLLTGSPAIDAANSGVSNWPVTDASSFARKDDPATPNSGTGPVPYADRGALEFDGDRVPPSCTIDTPPGNVTIFAGQSLDLTGTGVDPYGNPLSFLWDLGGGAPNQTVEDPHTVIFSTAGSYTVSLTVTDIRGASSVPVVRLVTVQPAPLGQAPDEVHWTFISQTAVTFDWRGFDNAIRYGLTPSYGQTATGVTPTPLPVSSPGPFWEARLSGLQENTTYHYSIGSGPDHVFHTPPTRGSSDFTVFVEGDIGASKDYPRVAVIQSQIAAGQPAFVLPVGDLTYANEFGQASVDQHFNDVMVWSQDAAYMPAWGNHEFDEAPSMENYKGRFDLPNAQASPGQSEEWSWFDYGNVRFIGYPEQKTLTYPDWNVKAITLMDQAQSDSAIRYIVTFGHEPAYSSGVHAGIAELKNDLDALGASHSKYVLNVNGHSHDYERSYPQNGVVHITAGGSGAHLEQTTNPACLWPGGCPPPPWSAYRAMHHGSLRMRVTASRIELAYICGPAGDPPGSPYNQNDVSCVEGSVLDSYVIGDQRPQVAAPGTATVAENGQLTVNVTASDPDGDAITSLTASGLPAGATFAAGSGNATGTLTWTPGYSQAGSYSVTFTAANALNSASTTVITVTNVDRAPVASASATASGPENALITVNVTASDPDGEAISSLTASGLPAGAAFAAGPGNTTGTLTWTPGYSQAGSYSLTFTAANALSGASSSVVTVTNVDRAPLVSAPATASGLEGALINVSVTASDPDGDAISSLTASGLPPGAAFAADSGNATGTLTWLTTQNDAGTRTVTFTAANALSGASSTAVIVINVDQAPVVSAPATASGRGNTLITVNVTASDPDGEAIGSLTASGLPPAATFAAAPGYAAGTLTWLTTASDVGTYTVTFTAANAMSGASSTVITVTEADRAPAVSVSATASGPENAPITVNVTASDPDGEAINSLTASGLPAGAAFAAGPGNTSGSLTWTPGYSQAGSYSVTFTAANALSGAASTVITVTNVDRAPVVSAPATASGLEIALITVNVTASDPDGEALTSLTASGLPAGAVFAAGPGNTSGTLTWTPGYSQAGSYSVSFTAANALSGASSSVVTVTNVDRAPVVSAPAKASVLEGTLITVNVTASDPDSEAITSLTVSGLPAGAAFAAGPGNTTGTLTWTPAVNDTGIHVVTFSAANALSGAAVSTITVNGLNQLPTAALKATPSTGSEPLPVTLDALGSMDPDGTIVSYLFNFGDGTTVGPQTGAVVGHVYMAGNWTAVVTVTDNNGGTRSASVPVTASIPPNWVTNTSFEVNLNGWNAQASNTLTRVAGGYDGGFAAQMTATGTTTASFGLNDKPDWVRTVSAAGIKYRFSAWVRSASNTGLAKIRVGEYEVATSVKLNEVITSGVRLSPAWQLVTLDYVTVYGPSTTTLDFWIKDYPVVAGETFQVDNVSIRAVTAPQAAPAMASEAEAAALEPEPIQSTPVLKPRFSPSPARSEGTLSFSTSRPGALRVEVLDAAGRRVRQLVDERDAPAGVHHLTVKANAGGEPLGPGIYFYRIFSQEGASTGRFVILH